MGGDPVQGDPFFRSPPVLTSCIAVVHDQDQEIDIGTKHTARSDFSSHIHTHLCVCWWGGVEDSWLCHYDKTPTHCPRAPTLASCAPPYPSLWATANLFLSLSLCDFTNVT